MLSKREKKELIFKTVTILLATIFLLSLIRALIFDGDFFDLINICTLFIQEFSVSILSALFVLSILYIFTNKEIYNFNNKAMTYAFTDALTGLYNRHYLNDFVTKSSFMRKDDAQYAVLFIDIDNFKLVNDSLGHMAGDCILKTLALKLKSLTRPKDILCRYGGEEFIIIFSDIPEGKALEKAEETRVSVENMLFDCQQVNITISIGLSFGNNESDINGSIQEADKALYIAKNAGRNCVRVFSS